MNVTHLPLVPGAVYELVPNPDLTTPVGGLITVEAVHRTGPQTWVTVYAPVLLDESEVKPGERRLQLHTWTVNACRIGRMVQPPATPRQMEAMRRIWQIIGDHDDPCAAARQAAVLFDNELARRMFIEPTESEATR